MKIIMCFFFTIFYSIVSSQNIKLTATATTNFPLYGDEFLGYDQFGFYYIINNNVFSKIDQFETLDYKNISLGRITKVDIQNPMKIILFYENFNTVIALDNQLNEIQKINFSESSVPLVATAIGLSAQNQLWIFNSMNQQLGQYNYLKNDYKTITAPFVVALKYYTSDFNYFYWIDTNNNFYMCDIFGKITSRGVIADYDAVLVINESSYMYLKNSILVVHNIQKDIKYTIDIPEKSFKKFSYKDQILSIFTNKGITNYKITIP